MSFKEGGRRGDRDRGEREEEGEGGEERRGWGGEGIGGGREEGGRGGRGGRRGKGGVGRILVWQIKGGERMHFSRRSESPRLLILQHALTMIHGSRRAMNFSNQVHVCCPLSTSVSLAIVYLRFFWCKSSTRAVGAHP